MNRIIHNRVLRPLHIGVVACSAEGASLCYKEMCANGPVFLGNYAHPEISMHTHSLAEYVHYLDEGNDMALAELMLDSAQKLARCGAKFLICPDNSVHQAFTYVEAESPLPWLHIAQVVAQNAQNKGYKRVGVMGTRWLLQSQVYSEMLAQYGVSSVFPNTSKHSKMHQIIMQELVAGQFNPQSIAFFQQEISRMQNLGCEAVILGCTEIPLIINTSNSVLPVLDSTHLLAKTALKCAVDHDFFTDQFSITSKDM